jgi:hypothetical protein
MTGYIWRDPARVSPIARRELEGWDGQCEWITCTWTPSVARPLLPMSPLSPRPVSPGQARKQR